MERKDEVDTLGASLLIGFSVLLGLNQALVKVVNDGFSPIFQSGLRSLAALPLVLLFAIAMKRRLSVTDGSLPWGILNGVFFCLEFGLLFVALDYTTVARVSLFFYIMPVWVAIGAHFLIPEEPMNRNKFMGLSTALIGVAIALSTDLGRAPANAWIGDLLALAGGFFWACIALLTRLKLSGSSSEMNLIYQLFVSAIVLCAIAPLAGPIIREPTTLIYSVFAFQVIAVAAFGFLAWFWLLTIYPVSNMSSFGLLSPIFGVFFGWLIFDDDLTLGFMVAMLAVSGGIVLVNKRMAPT
ncbi:MAG: EamA family transporter [Pseudomonadales bacterium]|nr:EamA family transporter [Pseudomonadales bacterium]